MQCARWHTTSSSSNESGALALRNSRQQHCRNNNTLADFRRVSLSKFDRHGRVQRTTSSMGGVLQMTTLSRGCH